MTPMDGTLAGLFADAFLRRARFAARSAGTLIDDHGLVGLRQGDGRVSLLVIDDDALAPLTALLGQEPQGVIRVLPAASRSRGLLTAQPDGERSH